MARAHQVFPSSPPYFYIPCNTKDEVVEVAVGTLFTLLQYSILMLVVGVFFFDLYTPLMRANNWHGKPVVMATITKVDDTHENMREESAV